MKAIKSQSIPVYMQVKQLDREERNKVCGETLKVKEKRFKTG